MHFSCGQALSQVSAGDSVLLQAWEKTRREQGERAAILDESGEVTRTFAGIEQRARFIAAQLRAFAPGQVIAIQAGNHPDWPSLLLACWREQMIALPLERSISEDDRSRAIAVCRARAIFALVRGCAGNEVQLLGNHTAKELPEWNGAPPVLLKATSGTTAAPRFIRFGAAQLLADCENICDTMGIGRGDLNYGVVPLSHSYGFSNLVTPLLAYGVPIVLSSDRMPRAILNGLAASKATVFPGMPLFYQSICDVYNPPPFPHLRLCVSAGAPLTFDLAERFRERFGRAIHSFYGSSECGGICYARNAEAATAGFVGEAMHGVAIEPVDPSSIASRIRVRSAAVGDGYFPEPDNERLGGGVFLPDDLLERTAAGYRIVGRVSDLINVAGKKVNPVEVEAEIRRCAGVREAVVFGRESERRNQEVAACIVTEGEVKESDLLAHCRARLSSWQVPRKIYLVDALPVNERGKISRRELGLRFPATRPA